MSPIYLRARVNAIQRLARRGVPKPDASIRGTTA